MHQINVPLKTIFERKIRGAFFTFKRFLFFMNRPYLVGAQHDRRSNIIKNRKMKMWTVRNGFTKSIAQKESIARNKNSDTCQQVGTWSFFEKEEDSHYLMRVQKLCWKSDSRTEKGSIWESAVSGTAVFAIFCKEQILVSNVHAY